MKLSEIEHRKTKTIMRWLGTRATEKKERVEEIGANFDILI